MLALLLALALGLSDARTELRELLRKEEPAYRERSLAINRELQTLRADPWAGTYGGSGGLGSNLISLAPRAGIGFARRGCTGILNLNHGEIRNFGADWVEVEWKIDPALDTIDYLGRQQPRFGSKLLVIPWGDEQYLVPEPRLMEFVNAVNAREPILVSCFWKRRVQEDLEQGELPPGLPIVPVALRSSLLETPLHCRCTAARDVADPHPVDLPRIWRELMVDSGAQQKLRVGMCLFAGSRWGATGEVVEVVGRFAKVEFRTLLNEAQRSALQAGIELSTRPPKD